jgi:hypothetical protein
MRTEIRWQPMQLQMSSLVFMKCFVQSFITIQQFLKKLNMSQYTFQQCLALLSSNLNTLVENPTTAQ